MTNDQALVLAADGRCPLSAGVFSVFQSARSGWSISQTGRRLRISGTLSKFSTGGGDVVDHSRVNACHGLRPATFPCRKLRKMFQISTKVPTAINTAPADDIMFNRNQPGLSAYW